MDAIDQDLEVMPSKLLARIDGRNEELMKEENVSLHSTKDGVVGEQTTFVGDTRL